MKKQLTPFNLKLFTPSQKDLVGFRPTKVLDITDGLSNNFHPEGLYSIETFGKSGDPRRNRLFSYIRLYTDIFHPLVFRALSDLKGLYGDIMACKVFATFDDKVGDFIPADPLSGLTGMTFFMQHYRKIKHDDRGVDMRIINVELLKKYENNHTFDYMLVMPAGLRDYTLDANGRPSEDEINGMYRKVISIANMISTTDPKLNSQYLDQTRFNLQKAVNDIYDYIETMLDGKNKFITGKWASRKIFNSTRNVLTSFVPENTELGGDRSVGTNHTVVGLFQYLRMTTPRTVYQVKELMSRVFNGPSLPANLIDPKTLKRVTVHVDPEFYDSWMTFEGIQSLIAKFSRVEVRHKVLKFEGYYPFLLWKPAGKYMLLQDIDDLPTDDPEARKQVTPITFAELLYLATYKGSDQTCSLFCRYPIAGYGSVYPAFTYVKSTVKSEIRIELDPSGEPTGAKAVEFPINGLNFHESACPSKAHIGRLTAD